jgi:hypothetical protein
MSERRGVSYLSLCAFADSRSLSGARGFDG